MVFQKMPDFVPPKKFSRENFSMEEENLSMEEDFIPNVSSTVRASLFISESLWHSVYVKMF